MQYAPWGFDASVAALKSVHAWSADVIKRIFWQCIRFDLQQRPPVQLADMQKLASKAAGGDSVGPFPARELDLALRALQMFAFDAVQLHLFDADSFSKRLSKAFSKVMGSTTEGTDALVADLAGVVGKNGTTMEERVGFLASEDGVAQRSDTAQAVASRRRLSCASMVVAGGNEPAVEVGTVIDEETCQRTCRLRGGTFTASWTECRTALQ